MTFACGSLTAPESEDSQDGIGGQFADASEINGSVPEQRSAVRSLNASRDPLDVLTADSGLHIGTVTNFEFAVPPRDPEPANVYTYADPLASADATWSVDSLLSGRADLRLDFTFRDEPGLYDEWLGVDIQSRVTDVSQYSTLVLWLSSDAPRVVRVRLDSTLYGDHSAGVLNEFDCTVQPEPQIFTLDLRQFHYSSWAEGFWRDEGGVWRTDAKALESLLQHFTGVVLEPVPQYDSFGQLSAAIETGHLRIDNLYFR